MQVLQSTYAITSSRYTSIQFTGHSNGHGICLVGMPPSFGSDWCASITANF